MASALLRGSPSTLHRSKRPYTTTTCLYLQLFCDACDLLVDLAVLHQLLSVAAPDAVWPGCVAVHVQLSLASSQGSRLARLGPLSMKLSKGATQHVFNLQPQPLQVAECVDMRNL